MKFLKKIKQNLGSEESSSQEAKKPEKEKICDSPTSTISCPTSAIVQQEKREEGELVIDSFETDSEFCVQSPIAGVSVKDLDISIEQEMLIIKGERRCPENKKDKKYFHQECYWGKFSRKIMLPKDVDPQTIKVSLEKGILIIKISIKPNQNQKDIIKPDLKDIKID